MPWTRWIIYGLPLALTLLTYWSAVQARAAREKKGATELVVASGDPRGPALNPYRIQSDAARELTSLMHEPLLRIDSGGHLSRGLAERWFWSQTISFWFAQEKFAQQAAAKLAKLDETQKTRVHLTLVDVRGNELRLFFSEPTPQTGAKIQEFLAEFGPLPVETVRVELEEPARGHHTFFMQNAVEREQIKDVWFDGANAYEVQVSGEALRLFEELSLYYQNRPELNARVRLVNKAPFLARSTMELQIREGAKFHDGKPVTSTDVARSLRLVADSSWPVPGRDALRRIHAMDVETPGSVRITFREPYGALPAALVDLPVLPAAWIERHGQDLDQDTTYILDPPPGTGLYKLAEFQEQRIVLKLAEGNAKALPQHVQILSGRTPGNIRAGFAMNAVDTFWPGPASVTSLRNDSRVTVHSSVPRNRLLVLWNCRRAPLNNLRVREALGLMLNREALLKELLHAEGRVDEGIFRPDLWFATERTPAPAGPAKARQTLYDLGWAKDAQEHLVKGGERFRIELLTVGGNAERLALAQRVADTWAEQGVDAVVTTVTWDDLLGSKLPRHEFDAVLLGLDYEVSWDQSPFWHSSQAARGLNYSGIADAPLDAMLDALRTETNLERIPVLARQVEERVMTLHPFLPLISGNHVLAVRRGSPVAVSPARGAAADIRRLLIGEGAVK